MAVKGPLYCFHIIYIFLYSWPTYMAKRFNHNPRPNLISVGSRIRAVGLGKCSKTNKHRAYAYFRPQSSLCLIGKGTSIKVRALFFCYKLSVMCYEIKFVHCFFPGQLKVAQSCTDQLLYTIVTKLCLFCMPGVFYLPMYETKPC